MSELHDIPTGFSRVRLPDDWSRPAYIVLPLVLGAIFGLHAWYTGHVRRYGCPPLFFFRLRQFFMRDTP